MSELHGGYYVKTCKDCAFYERRPYGVDSFHEVCTGLYTKPRDFPRTPARSCKTFVLAMAVRSDPA